MPFSHHSHSGEFCPGHARDSLEDVIKAAITKQFKVFGLTEHMPRHDQDRYPEEIEAGSTLESLIENEARYISKAQELREKYGSRLSLPIGFESEWCGSHSLELIQRSLDTHPYEFFMGSIHHVRGVPIDYDEATYARARNLAGNADEALFGLYFDEQLEMLKALLPPVVGHFDLIRLKSETPDIDWRTIGDVWAKILRNLDFIASYGGILELNTSALRKGLGEPYPKSEICKEFLERKGRFCLSDDSHGIGQVGTNYDRILDFISRNNIEDLYYLEHMPDGGNTKDARFPTLSIKSIPVRSIKDHATLSETKETSPDSVQPNKSEPIAD